MLSGQAVGAIATARFEAGRRLGRMSVSCPAFVDDTTLFTEHGCAWLRVVGSETDRDADSTDPGYVWRSIATVRGGQREVRPGWFLGGTLGYESHRMRDDIGVARIDGDACWRQRRSSARPVR